MHPTVTTWLANQIIDQQMRIRAYYREYHVKNRGKLLIAKKAIYRRRKAKHLAENYAWREANRERYLAGRRKRRAERKNVDLPKRRAQSALNREKLREQDRAWKSANRAKLAEQQAARRAANPAKYRAKDKKFRAKYKECRAWYDRHVKMANPQHQIGKRLRNRLRALLRHCGGKKASRTWDLVGCSWPDLKAHLEKQFAPGMSWENMHLWHVDHIRPCASFDLTDEYQQMECFHYSNLQPLWAADNLSKNAKYTPSEKVENVA